MSVRIGFIGSGKMAEALVDALISKKLYKKSEIVACAPSLATRSHMTETYGIKMYETATEVVEVTDTLILAVKPDQVPTIFNDEKVVIGEGKNVISIVAGLTLDKLKTYVPGAKTVRVMPNHCCQVLEGAMGFACDESVTDDDKFDLNVMLNAVGVAVEVPEEHIDAITGIAGSSPAFMYMVIDAMADAGVMAGLKRDDSIQLAAQSMLGAAKMVLDSGKHPDQLKDEVCSPGGTTIVGVNTLEQYSVRAAFIAAVTDTIEKSKELSKL